MSISAYRAALLALLATPALACCSSGADDSQTAPAAAVPKLALTKAQLNHIHLYTVTPLPYQHMVEAPGIVDFDNDQATAVMSPFTGPVTRLLVSLGQQVAAGQPLAIVQSADLATAAGAYRRAEITARNLRQLADTDHDLAAHEGIPAREAAQAQADATAAEADRDAALQSLNALNGGARGSQGIGGGGVIRAPIAGTIVEKSVTPGQLLQAGTSPTFTVANLSRVWVQAQIPTADLAAVAVGDQARIDTGIGAATTSGVVDNVGASVDPNSRAVLARVVVANPGDRLKKQMYVTVSIRSAHQKTGLLVPASAVLRNDENLPFVYVALPDGGFARRMVTLGYRDAGRYELTDGIRAGDRVVVDGAIFLQFMQSQ